MGAACGGQELTPEELEQRSRNAGVDDEIGVDREKARMRHKLLLLGSGNSGKSTFFKQLCSIHGDGLQVEDTQHAARYIHEAIIHQMKTIIETCQDKGLDIGPEAIGGVDHMVKLNKDQKVTPQVAKMIAALWEDPAIRKTFEERTSLGIVDSCPHFFDNIERIGQIDYEPTEEDILLARIPTTGIRENTFKVKGNLFEIYDVGGQRNERQKWIHCFDCVDAVLFVASLSCYDQNLFEDEEVNAMQEALQLFHEVVNNRFFRKTSMILFLNKADLFAEKIMHKPLTVAFDDYEGEEGDFDMAVTFIRDKFKAQLLPTEEEKVIFTHVTTATEKENVERVFDDVQNGVVMRSLHANGLI